MEIKIEDVWPRIWWSCACGGGCGTKEDLENHNCKDYMSEEDWNAYMERYEENKRRAARKAIKLPKRSYSSMKYRNN